MTKSSFFTAYGQFSCPVIFLTVFGWFHFKTGPLSTGCVGKLSRVYSVIILLLTEVIIINYLVNNITSISIEAKTFKLLDSIGVGFFIFLVILMPAVTYLSHRRVKNMSGLIMDVCQSKEHKFSLGCSTNMLLCGFLVLVSITNLFYTYGLYIRQTVVTGQLDAQSVFGKYNPADLIGSLVYVERILDILFCFSMYGAILCTSLLISLICLYLGNEFDACARELSNCLKNNNEEYGNNFKDIKKTFRNLSGLVESVNDHFSFYIGYNILTSLFTICAMAYALTLILEDWELPGYTSHVTAGIILPVIIMASNVFLLTIPVSFLHTKVSVNITPSPFNYNENICALPEINEALIYILLFLKLGDTLPFRGLQSWLKILSNS